MAHRNRWRRAVITALALTMLLAFPGGIARAARPADVLGGGRARVRSSSARTVPRWVCDYPWRRGKRQIKRLIGCAAHRWKVRGGAAKAIDVASCESGLNPKAYNPGGYAGVFQQSTRYWPERATSYGLPKRSVFNGRANVIVSIRMAHDDGWGAWGCA
ncbi:MAG TPA: hypothetical protein VFC04_09050 [Actinomycetota bacterium]|jgi:hypothetical protein|nr:hypothetical protein [Actinomycetota bacterium]